MVVEAGYNSFRYAQYNSSKPKTNRINPQKIQKEKKLQMADLPSHLFFSPLFFLPTTLPYLTLPYLRLTHSKPFQASNELHTQA